jgi:hypothetical protein
MTSATWRADFFDNATDTFPSSSELIHADSENAAAEQAAARMGAAVRVDLIRTVFKRVDVFRKKIDLLHPVSKK